jgi:hypothetical protein
LESSGKFTIVHKYKGVSRFFATVLGGDVDEGTWELNQDGTKIGMRLSDTNVRTRSTVGISVTLANLILPYWSKITEIDKDHIKLSNWEGEEVWERIQG